MQGLKLPFVSRREPRRRHYSAASWRHGSALAAYRASFPVSLDAIPNAMQWSLRPVPSAVGLRFGDQRPTISASPIRTTRSQIAAGEGRTPRSCGRGADVALARWRDGQTRCRAPDIPDRKPMTRPLGPIDRRCVRRVGATDRSAGTVCPGLLTLNSAPPRHLRVGNTGVPLWSATATRRHLAELQDSGSTSRSQLLLRSLRWSKAARAAVKI